MNADTKSAPWDRSPKQGRLAGCLQPLALQFARYGIAGSIALGVHLAALAFLVDGFGLNETTASAIGFACAVPVNYYLQRRFVFRSSAALARSFTAYCAVTIAMLGVNTLAFWILVARAGMYYLEAQLLTTLGIVILNYCVNRSVTFPERQRP